MASCRKLHLRYGNRLSQSAQQPGTQQKAGPGVKGWAEGPVYCTHRSRGWNVALGLLGGHHLLGFGL